STVNCQLSTVNCQLSTVNCQLSTVNNHFARATGIDITHSSAVGGHSGSNLPTQNYVQATLHRG
ncbi:hypothetical protein QUA00_04740, partial [Microcoleus sp. T2B6]|uniref:hypothetical protein n=1 Tax=unclassified Microcoleus TaxID=2642155 RepID=UPI002FD40B09